jgi:protein SCO1/2
MSLSTDPLPRTEIDERQTSSAASVKLFDVVHPFIYRLTGSPWFWILFVLTLMSFPLARAKLTKERLIPPTRYPEQNPQPLPPFQFTNELGKSFGTEQLQGKIWVANFIFTSCPSICPSLTKTMLELRQHIKHLKGFIHLVSFTVDPVRDTPERLKKYGIEYHYDPKVWSFVTGPLEKLDKIIIDSFKSAISRPQNVSEDPSLFEIGHGRHFVLVDRQGYIRGFYGVMEENGEINKEEMNRLLVDIALVANYY